MGISIRKLAVAVAVGVFMASGVAFAQQGGEAEDGAVDEDAIEEEVAEEIAPPPPPQVAAPAPVVEAAPVAAAAAPAAKPETKVDFYGAAQYRFRDRLHSISDTASGSGSTNDYQNLFSWRAGLKAKVNDQLSLQFQIGNDWGAGEAINWSNNNTPSGRVGFQNLYVHIASFKWNPGYLFVEGGVISLPSNGTLDLLERSINLGHYGEAGFQGWSTEVNSSLLGIKLGIPILKDDFKLGLELFQTVIDQRTQTLAPRNEIPSNPSSPMFVVTLPIEVSGLKLTPEVTALLNRNYNSAIEKGDNEILFGASAGYAVNKEISISLFGGSGSVSNENSKVGGYSTNVRSAAIPEAAADSIPFYTSNGLIVGVGTAIKAGPGTIQFDFKYNSAVNAENEDGTKYDYTYADIRYAYKANDKFTITPRYRNYYRTFPPNNANASRMENRLELILEGSF